ncbi:MAG: response regulator [Candidatus Riflebacteria bacterium]|nr:response regulator [Candidatus Riflebacteria bacterium]
MANILIVDDDVDFVAIQREVLERDGNHVDAVHTAQDGLEWLAKNPLPDLIMVDLMIERDDAGFTFCHAVKRDARTAKIPVLMLTGVSKARSIGFDLKSPSSREWIKADDFAEKPIRPDILLAKVHHLLGQPAEKPAPHGS